MPADHTPESLNRQTFASFRTLFKQLTAPTAADLVGDYLAEFVGPAWLRRSAPFALAVGGLKGWSGKRFMADGTGINLVTRNGNILERRAMAVRIAGSAVDGKPAAIVSYGADAGFPWTRINDELRMLSGKRMLLGVMILKVPGLDRLCFPFLLQKNAGS